MVLKTQPQALGTSGSTQTAQTVVTAPTQEAVEALLDLCEREEQKRRRISSSLITVLLVVTTGFAALMYVALFTQKIKVGPWLPLSSALLNVFIAITGWVLFSPNNRKRKYMDALLKSDDPRVLMPFLDTFRTAKTEKGPALIQELARRLWQIGPDDALTLDAVRREAIREILARFYPWRWSLRRGPIAVFSDEMCDVVVSALRAVTVLGDAKARRTVRQIARFPAKTSNEKCVQEVAQECLVLLETQIAEKAKATVRIEEALHSVKQGDILAEFLRPFLLPLTPDAAKVGLVEYQEKQQFIRRRNFWIQQAVFAMLVVIAYFVMQAVHFPGKFQVPVYFALNFLCNLAGSGFSSVLPSERAAAIALSLYGDARLVGPLLNAHKKAANYQIEDALKNLLPQIRSGDGYLVSPRQRAHLRRIVGRSDLLHSKGTQQDLVVAALDALRVLGDTKAVGAARRIARVSGSPAVCHAAKRLIAAHADARKTEKARAGTMTP